MRSIPVLPPSSFTSMFLYGVAMLFACYMIYLYANPASPLTPPQARDQMTGLVSMIAMAGLLVGGVLWAVRRRSLTLTASELIVRAGFYTRRIPRSALRVAEAIECSLFEQRELAPRWRTNGMRVPGFQAGWFRLVNKEKALVLITDPRHVTCLPTTAGFMLLVSATGLIDALNEPGG